MPSRLSTAMRWPVAPPAPTRRALIGVLAAGAGLAATSLISALLPGGQSPITSVGDEIVSLTPSGAREAAIGVLGTADKPFILLSVAGVTLAVGALLGLAARRDRLPLAVGGGVLLAIGLAATGDSSPAALPGGLAAAAGAAAAGAWTVGWLSQAAAHPRGGPALGTPVRGSAPDPPRPPARWADREMSRRQFTLLAATVAVVAAAGQGLASLLGSFGSTAVDAFRASVRLPRVARPLPAPATADSFAQLAGVTPLVTPNASFYRIDTAFIPPAVDPSTWTLTVDGMVNRVLRFSWDRLLAMPQVEADITLCCVSDPVGGNLVSNARWQGVPLAAILEMAGVRPGADQLVGVSVDGFTAGFPTALALDGRAALVAVGMNGQPLPVDHGFPARLVVPGLYGYVSATKWLTEIRLTTFSALQGYWIQRGWANPAPVYTESRIDVPQDGGQVAAGTVWVAGVAWAQHRGITGVQVRVDSGPWMDAELAGELSIDTWRQWRLPWQATAGTHTLEVRARDSTGAWQTSSLGSPFPAGATGYDAIQLSVT